jgi:uncharacterized protein DUF4129
MTGRPERTGAEFRRAAAVLLLIAIAVVGLRAGAHFPTARSPALVNAAGQILYWTAVSLWAVLVVLGVAAVVLWFFWARKGAERPSGRRRRRGGIWWLLLLPLEVVALSRILNALRQHASAQAAHAKHVPAAKAPAAHGWHLLYPPPGSWPLLAALAVAALAAVMLARPRRRRGPGAPLPGPEPAAGDGQAPLLAALDAGAGVLAEDPDPRTAIVNCYAAMETSLARAGSPPSAADTPAELLRRAAAGGLIHSAAADTLTGLFRRARYSTHPVTEADRASALAALAQLRTELGAPA